jgi:hypothetical protein
MAKKLISYDEWINRTKVFARPRSDELVAIDKILKAYDKESAHSGRVKLREDLKKALDAWKKKEDTEHKAKDAWKKSGRNKDRAVEHLTARLESRDRDTALGETDEFMHEEVTHTRLGVLYLFGNTEVDSNLFTVILEGGINMTNGLLGFAGAKVADGGMGIKSATTGSAHFTATMVPAKELFSYGEQAAYETPAKRTLKEKGKTWFGAWLEKVFSTLKDKVKDPGFWATMGKGLLNLMVAIFAEAAAPFVSSGLDMAKGVVQTLDNCYQRYQSWKRGKGVELLYGHPSTVVASLNEAMTMGIFEGLYTTLKGAAGAALTVATAGAGMIANLVIAICEMVIKLIWRMVELTKMDKCFREAKDYYKLRHSPHSIHLKPFEFAHWYKHHVAHQPALAALTLNSGICGDKMHWIKLVHSNANPDVDYDQDSFDRGVAFIDFLKIRSVEYLNKVCYNFRSADPMVSALLELAKKDRGDMSKARKVLLAIANG